MKYLLFITFITLATPALLYAQEKPDGGVPIFEVPETLDEAKEVSLDTGERIMGVLPGVVRNIWDTQVLPVWRNMAEWAKEELWHKWAQPRAQNLLNKARELLGREVDKRRPIIEQELEQEKQELAQDIKTHGENAGKGLWERFWSLLRNK
jgi:hypothetical protein